MGSCGTIAYLNKSDSDIWLIHSRDLSSESIEELADMEMIYLTW
jgi:adenylate cyclase